jgi:hypothetical protein
VDAAILPPAVQTFSALESSMLRFFRRICAVLMIFSLIAPLTWAPTANAEPTAEDRADEILHNKACTKDAYLFVLELRRDVNPEFEAKFGYTADLHSLIDKINLSTDFWNLVQYSYARVKYQYCTGELSKADVKHACDVDASPPVGPANAPRIPGGTTIDALGTCDVALELDQNDPLINLEYARAYYIYAMMYPGTLETCPSMCTPSRIKGTLYQGMHLGHPYGKILYCMAMINIKELHPTQAEYELAMAGGVGGWDESENGYAADCVATLYYNGYGISAPNYERAIYWWTKALDAGLDETGRIAEAKTHHSLPSGAPVASNSGGAAAGAVVAVAGLGALLCGLTTGCSKRAWEITKDIAKDAAEHEAAEALLNGLKKP